MNISVPAVTVRSRYVQTVLCLMIRRLLCRCYVLS